jgi:sec-independent protein translocase protein TatB
MLDFGFSEVLLTSAIALVVLGPEKLPKVARQVGNWMGRARLMARQLSEQLEREVNAEELLKQQTKSSVPASPAVLPAPTGATPSTVAADPAEVGAMPVVAPPVRRPPHPNSPEVMHANSPAVDSAATIPEAPPAQTSVEPQQSTQ